MRRLKQQQRLELLKNKQLFSPKRSMERYGAHLQKNLLEKGELEGLSKKEKGMKAAEWLMRTAAKKYLHVTREVAAQESLEKDNTWKSEKQMLDQFDWQELQAHLASGRVTWRHDPHTPSVYQCKDLQSYKGSAVVNRGQRWQQGQEMEPGEEEAV